MESSMIIVVGKLPMQQPWLEELIQTDGWKFKTVSGLIPLREFDPSNIAAILINAHSLQLPWKDCLLWIRSVAPNTLCILCHGFTETLDWISLTSCGAYHSLHLPLDPSEVRQALGFVSMSRNQSNGKTLSIAKLAGCLQNQ